MAYKKQLRDKNGNVVYPDVGLNLDDVVYSDDPSETIDNIIDPASYSMTEHKTGGTWIDGKPIYKKTYHFGALPNHDSKYLNVDWGTSYKMIKLEIVARNNTNGGFHHIDGVYGAAGGAIYENAFFQNSTGTPRIAITTDRDRTEYDAWATLYYTKD